MINIIILYHVGIVVRAGSAGAAFSGVVGEMSILTSSFLPQQLDRMRW